MRIIIIEDEGITRQWLNKKITELGPEYHVEGIFSNGSQALSFFESGGKADVIFTDIRMPVMDGLEFLEKLDETGRKPYKIILSSYDEFQYARRAIKLGANEFVLKPEITKDTLKQILSDARKNLEQSRPDTGPEKEKSMVEEKGILLFQLLGTKPETEADRILNSKAEPVQRSRNDTEKEALLKIFGIGCPETSLTRLVITDFYLENQTAKENPEELIHLFLEQENIDGAFFLINNQEFVLGYLHQKITSRKEVMDRLSNILQIHLGCKVYAGISRMDGYEKIREMYHHATVAKENRIFFGMPGCQQYDDMHVNEKQDNGKFYYGKEIKEITEYLSLENYAAAADRIKSFLINVREAHYLPPAYVKALCNEILSAFLHEIWKYPLTDEERSHVVDMNLFLGKSPIRLDQLTDLMLEETDYFNKFLQKKKISSNTLPPSGK